jgi:hypothetical protein
MDTKALDTMPGAPALGPLTGHPRARDRVARNELGVLNTLSRSTPTNDTGGKPYELTSGFSASVREGTTNLMFLPTLTFWK